MESVAKQTLSTGPQPSWVWFLFITIALGLAWYFVNSAVDFAEVSRNWPKYRCNPAIMPFAGLYGYNVKENFNYCVENIFKEQAGSVTGPFASILGVMVQNAMTFLKSLNSLRMMFATMVGGITKIIQEFTDRFKLVFSQVRITAQRLQVLFQRLQGTLFSVMYMAMSGVTAGLNFGDTFIFKFLDTFCFPPETEIDVAGKGLIPIKDVRLGDICKKTGAKVTSTYQFYADGQPMVNLKDIQVSTNHFVSHKGVWIEAANHPDAKPCRSWSGGIERPLVCLDTSSHEIPLGTMLFSDWDETDGSDEVTMTLSEIKLNGGKQNITNKPRPWLYQPALNRAAALLKKDGSTIIAKQVKLGEELSMGRVVGLGHRLVKQIVILPNQVNVTPSTLVWKDGLWQRAGHLYEVKELNKPIEMVTFIVFPTGSIELADGTILRDMFEVHSPDMEGPTREKLQLQSNPTKAFLGSENPIASQQEWPTLLVQ
jgi:hypothetical protein